MPGITLYFSNQELRTCWPVKNCLGNPTLIDITRKSPPYRNNHPYSTDVQVIDGSGLSAGSLSLKGTALVPAALTPASVAAGSAGNLLVDQLGLAPIAMKTDDNVAQAALRQSDLDYTHWEVAVVQADPSDPDTMLVSLEQYPDGFSNRPPSWWEDPDAV